MAISFWNVQFQAEISEIISSVPSVIGFSCYLLSYERSKETFNKTVQKPHLIRWYWKWFTSGIYSLVLNERSLLFIFIYLLSSSHKKAIYSCAWSGITWNRYIKVRSENVKYDQNSLLSIFRELAMLVCSVTKKTGQKWTKQDSKNKGNKNESLWKLYTFILLRAFGDYNPLYGLMFLKK